MFSDSQLLYIDEVLGVTARHFQSAEPASDKPFDLLVLTGPMTGPERELLNKILYSVRLPQPVIEESFTASSPAVHVLSFSGSEGREGSQWNCPKLSEMLASGADVNAKKKATWNLLQQLAKEFAR